MSELHMYYFYFCAFASFVVFILAAVAHGIIAVLKKIDILFF